MPITRTVSVLVAELVGSTELAEELGDDRTDVVRRLHRDRQCDAMSAHGGIVVDGLGECVMAVFEGATQAMTAAAQLHEITADLMSLHHSPLELRVGVSAGDAISEAGNWFGPPVIEASLLCGAAASGEVLVSDLVRRLAGTRTQLQFESLEPLHLEGLEDPVAAHRVILGNGAHREQQTSFSTDGVRLRLIGSFGVALDGIPFVDRDLGSRKARTLLKVLAADQGQLVPMDRLVEILWEGSPPRNAEANVATLISRLRGVLGTDVISGGRSGYRFASCTSDIDDAERLVNEAEDHLRSGRPTIALTAARAALDLLGAGRVLVEETAAEWTVEITRHVDRLLRRARSAAWTSSLEIGDPRSALSWAQDAVATDQLDEDAHRAVIRSYHDLGETGEALRAHELLRALLADELGADPGPETQALYTAVLRGVAWTPEPSAVPDARIDSGATAALVGRERELEDLLDAWSSACGGATSCVLVTGDPGIGKSRLAIELASTARSAGAVVLQTRCFEAERSLFLQPVVELVRAAVTGLAPDMIRRAVADRVGPLTSLVPEVSQLVRPVGYEPASGEIERRRVFEAVAAFLGGLARQRPLLLVVDDLHLAGASAVELLHFAIRWDMTAPLLVVATVRADEATQVIDQLDHLASRMELGPLDERAVRQLAAAAGLDDRADAVMRMTRGHTLFVVEALRALNDQGGGATGSSTVPVPGSLLSAVVARVERCGDEVEEFLRAAVVVGSSFDLSVVADLLSLRIEEAADRADRAHRAGILLDAGARYEISNDVIREVLYDTTPAPVREARHRRLAEMMSHRPEAAAGHAAAAGDHAAAARCWLEAGDAALISFANQDAEQLFARALETAQKLDDPSIAARACLGRGRSFAARGMHLAAAQEFGSAERLANTAADHALESVALTELAWCAYFTREMSRADGLAKRAAAHPQSGVAAQVLVGRLRHTDGDLSSALALLEPLTRGDSHGAQRANALSCLGTALAHSDRYEHAASTLDEAIASCRDTGMLRGMVSARFFAAFTRINLGDITGGMRHADVLLAEVDRYEIPAYRPRALNLLAWSWRELGDLARARDLAEQAYEASGALRDQVEGEPAANALLALAESAVLAGDGALVDRHLTEIDPLLESRVAYGWRIQLHRLDLLAAIDPTRAEELLDRARRHGSAKYEALALAHLGRAEAAAAVARRTGSVFLLARVAPEPEARRSFEAMANALPEGLRDGFVRRGALARRLGVS